MSREDIQEQIEDFKSFIESLNKRLPVNEHDLVGECRNQPILHQECREQLSVAKLMYNRQKVRYNRTYADQCVKIRDNPGAYNLDKATKDAVQDCAQSCKEVRGVEDDLLELEGVVDALNGFIESIKQRKSFIRDLVTLFVHNYYESHNLQRETNAAKDIRRESYVQSRRRRRAQDSAHEEED